MALEVKPELGVLILDSEVVKEDGWALSVVEGTMFVESLERVLS